MWASSGLDGGFQLLLRPLSFFFKFFWFPVICYTFEGIWASGWASSGLGGGFQLLLISFVFGLFSKGFSYI